MNTNNIPKENQLSSTGFVKTLNDDAIMFAAGNSPETMPASEWYKRFIAYLSSLPPTGEVPQDKPESVIVALLNLMYGYSEWRKQQPQMREGGDPTDDPGMYLETTIAQKYFAALFPQPADKMEVLEKLLNDFDLAVYQNRELIAKEYLQSDRSKMYTSSLFSPAQPTEDKSAEEILETVFDHRTIQGAWHDFKLVRPESARAILRAMELYKNSATPANEPVEPTGEIKTWIENEAKVYEKVGSHFSDDWKAGANALCAQLHPEIEKLKKQGEAYEKHLNHLHNRIAGMQREIQQSHLLEGAAVKESQAKDERIKELEIALWKCLDHLPMPNALPNTKTEIGDAVHNAYKLLNADQKTSSKEPAPTEDWEKECRKEWIYKMMSPETVEKLINWIKSHVPMQSTDPLSLIDKVKAENPHEDHAVFGEIWDAALEKLKEHLK